MVLAGVIIAPLTLTSFDHGTVLGFQRALGRERTLVLINFGTEARRVQVPGLRAGAGLRRLHGPRGAPLTLPPLSVRVFDVR